MKGLLTEQSDVLHGNGVGDVTHTSSRPYLHQSECPTFGYKRRVDDVLSASLQRLLRTFVASPSQCNRTFEHWESCHTHVAGRGHAGFCQYDSSSLPPCVSSHSMLPFDPYSGWCDVQGRRSRIEDYHSIVFQEDYKFYGVFDGHCGTRAAKYASRALHVNLELFLNTEHPLSPSQAESSKRRRGRTASASPLQRRQCSPAEVCKIHDHEARAGHDSQDDEREHSEKSHADETMEFVERAVRAAFRKTQADFLATAQSGSFEQRPPNDTDGWSGSARHECRNSACTISSNDAESEDDNAGHSADGSKDNIAGALNADDNSGTTATVAVVYPDVTVVAHVGDSRAVMCCDKEGRAVEITRDHTPHHDEERARVEANGGFIELRGVLRVNGELAVTRTIGNRRLHGQGVLSSEPDIVYIIHDKDHSKETLHREYYGAKSVYRGEQQQNSPLPSEEIDAHTDSVEQGNADSVDEVWTSDTRKHFTGARRHDPFEGTSFLVLASDGLWDVLTNQEAVDMVKEVIEGVSPISHRSSVVPLRETLHAGRPGARRNTGNGFRVPRGYGVYSPDQVFQVAATALTHEAYVRGSTDNIGVCVVDLRPHR